MSTEFDLKAAFERYKKSADVFWDKYEQDIIDFFKNQSKANRILFIQQDIISPEIQLELAKRTSSPKVLEWLSYSRYNNVREKVTQNTHTERKVKTRMAMDTFVSSDYVELSEYAKKVAIVFQNYSEEYNNYTLSLFREFEGEVINVYSHDKNSAIKKVMSQFSPEDLVQIAKHTHSSRILELLSYSEDEKVRLQVAGNQFTTISVLNRMRSEQEGKIANAARMTYEHHVDEIQ